MQKRKEYRELQQEKIKEETIMNSVIESNEKGTKCIYTEEQILEAQERKAFKQINELYDSKIFPYANNVMFVCYYTFSLVTFPFLYYGEFQGEIIVAALVLFMMLISIVVLKKLSIWLRRKCIVRT